MVSRTIYPFSDTNAISDSIKKLAAINGIGIQDAIDKLYISVRQGYKRWDTVLRSLHTNNWLKMHGFPKKRRRYTKDMGRRNRYK